MSGYTKLFNTILASSVWRESHTTRIVWITLLAMSNRDGIVEGAIPGIAHIAGVTLDECQEALDRLKSPDKWSRSQDYDGRRIEEVPGGFRLLNHGVYREKLNADERREYLRRKKQESRERLRRQQESQQPSTTVPSTGTPSTHSREQSTESRVQESPVPQVVPLVARPDTAVNVSEKDIERREVWAAILANVSIPARRVDEYLKPCLIRDIRTKGEVRIIEVNCPSARVMRWIADNYKQQLAEAAQQNYPGGKFKFEFVYRPLSTKGAA